MPVNWDKRCCTALWVIQLRTYSLHRYRDVLTRNILSYSGCAKFEDKLSLDLFVVSPHRDGQSTYNVTMRSVRVTTVAVEKQ